MSASKKAYSDCEDIGFEVSSVSNVYPPARILILASAMQLELTDQISVL